MQDRIYNEAYLKEKAKRGSKMFNYSLNQIIDCFLDYYKEPNSYDYSTWFYGWSLPKDRTVNYPNHPVMNHYINKDGNQELQFACTGFEKEELVVKVENDCLIVKAERKSKEDRSDEKILHNKLAVRDFEVSFKISEKLDAENITSSYKNGLLSVFIPLSQEIKKKNKSIEIK